MVDRLEAALAKLEQDGDDQDSWDQVSNAFQFLADSAREGTTFFCDINGRKRSEGYREKRKRKTIAITASSHVLLLSTLPSVLVFVYSKDTSMFISTPYTPCPHTLPHDLLF